MKVATKAVIFALLVVNTGYFLVADTRSKGIDSAAWLVLLGLFEAETTFGTRLETPGRRLALRMARLLAAAGVIAATVGYVFEDNVLDAANSALWIAVVILLEGQLRFPHTAERFSAAFTSTAVGLYAGLALLVLLWAAEGMWLDAYDALLWLIAFVVVELRVSRSQPTR